MSKFSLNFLNSYTAYKEGHGGNIGNINPSLKRVKLTSTTTPTGIMHEVIQMPMSFKNMISQADKTALLNNISSSSRALLAKYTNLQLTSSLQSQAKKEENQSFSSMETGTTISIEDHIQINMSRDDDITLDTRYKTPRSKRKCFDNGEEQPSLEIGLLGLSATDPKKQSKIKLMDQEETLKKKQPNKSKTPVEHETHESEKKFMNSLQSKKILQYNLLTPTKQKSKMKKSDLLISDSKTQEPTLDSSLFTIGGDVFDLENLKQSPWTKQEPKKPINKKEEGLVSVKDYGLQDLFPFEYFNAVQSECFNLVWNSNDNIIVSAPTGSGKTVLFELAIARYVLQARPNGFAYFKAIYIAPIKALCQQKFNEWKKKFSVYSLNILELTGDADITDFSQYDTAHIIVTTPEKWDAITRRWKDNSRLVTNISLLLIDEVHLLNTEERGATLEAIVARMKTISKSEEYGKTCCLNLRTIAISATIPNIKDLGEWLEVRPEYVKNFGDEYRSTPIEKHVFGYVMPRNEFQFEKSLDFKLAEIIRKFSSGKPTLVFCQTQRGTINACEQITIDMNSKEFVKGEAQIKKLTEVARKLMDKNLQKFVPYGVAFHNAGMSYDDRKTIEDLFINGFIQVICTTTTLAMGVNLPARLVIIKSTLCYRGTGVGYTEYSPLEIDQMIGRAGRPQFDTHGVVVIMTEKHQVERYRKQVIEKEDLESHFPEQLAEHINAEISLRSLRNLDTVVKYLKGTFFYVRMLKNPNNYGINEKALCNAKMIDEYLTSLSKKVLKELHQYEMIQYNVQDGTVNPLDLGTDMSRYYIAFATLKKMHENQDKQDLKGLLSTLSEAQEFEKLRSKLEERKTLSHLNTLIKFPLIGAVSTSSKKAFVLLQAGIGNISFEDWELKRQMNDIMNTSLRIIQCFKRFYLIKRAGQGFANCLKLLKFVNMRTWEDNKTTILKQLPGIGDKLAANLCDAHLETFEKLDNTPSHITESVCNKNPPFGIQLQKRVKQIPRLNINIFDVNPDGLKVGLALVNKDKILPPERWELRCGFQFIVQDKANRVQFIRYLPVDNDLARGITVSISGIKGLTFPLTVLVINERYVGVDLKYLVHANGVSSSFCGEFSPPREKDMAIEKEMPRQKAESIIEEKKWNLYNMTMRCSHKCKDKKKCKHACCKVGTISPPKREIKNTGKSHLQSTLDVIDENIEYIEAFLEKDNKEHPLSPHSKNILEVESSENLQVTEKKKKEQQTDIMTYMTAKKEKYEPPLEKMKINKIESFNTLFYLDINLMPGTNKQKVDKGSLKESCRSLLEKYGVFDVEQELPQNMKIEPQEQFHKLFGNIFN